MPQHMRRDSFGDPRRVRDFFHHLLNPSGRKGRVPVGLEEIAFGPSAQMGPQFLSQLGQTSHVTPFTALTLLNQYHLFIKKDISDLDVYKLRNPCTGLK